MNKFEQKQSRVCVCIYICVCVCIISIYIYIIYIWFQFINVFNCEENTKNIIKENIVANLQAIDE